jgi:hypothetical protein
MKLEIWHESALVVRRNEPSTNQEHHGGDCPAAEGREWLELRHEW